ncbi:sensor histidine kinase [Paenibacillus thailandensis]|uniref:histidine kinase n=1 Tax=Paenibacillus thailandensis TaxID=393250 RepID=A0ABW5QRK1_9BACL
MPKRSRAGTEYDRTFLPLGVKLMVSYLLVTLVPISLFGYLANRIMIDSIRSQATSSIQGTLQQIKDNIVYKLEDTIRLSDSLYYDETIAKHLMHYEEGWVSYEATTKYLIPAFRKTIESTNRKVWLSVYLKNETLPEIYYDMSGDRLRTNGSFFDMLHLKRIVREPWYEEFPEESYGNTIVWRQIGDDVRYGRISLLRRMVDTSSPLNLQEIGMMRFTVYLSDLFESVNSGKIGSGTSLYIANEAGDIYHSSGGWTDGKDVAEAKRQGDPLVIEQTLPWLGWRLIAIVPNQLLEQNTAKVTRMTWMIGSLSFLIISFIAWFVGRFFSRRISKLLFVLESFRRGDYHKRFRYRGNDEFAIIAQAINQLGEQTESLIKEVYVTNLKKKEAELESLQAQINPHFLYNTLSSISRLAKFGEVDKQHQMIMNLAKFYRLSLNNGQTIITIASEVEQVQAYLNIQLIKYGDRVQAEFRIDPSIVNLTTIKLILQPFVENVLEHAWRGDRIHLRIEGQLEEGRVVFRIIDDGIGMPRHALQSLFQEQAQEKRGYGIRNVHERIQLYYGKPYGVLIHSRSGIGTTVVVTIPAQGAARP